MLQGTDTEKTDELQPGLEMAIAPPIDACNATMRLQHRVGDLHDQMAFAFGKRQIVPDPQSLHRDIFNDRPDAGPVRQDQSGWRLSQEIASPVIAMFGVRQTGDIQHLTLALPLARGATAPTSAHLILRDPQRGAMREIALPQRISQGLQAGLPSPMASASIASTRTIERRNNQQMVVFTFPDTAFRDLVALDPRESVELRLETGRATQSLLVEVGDVAAARAFLTLRR